MISQRHFKWLWLLSKSDLGFDVCQVIILTKTWSYSFWFVPSSQSSALFFNVADRIAGSAQYCRINEKWIYCFPLIWRIKYSLQICCNPRGCFKIRVIKFYLCCNSMISQSLPNFKTQFSQEEEVSSYDNIALNQTAVSSHTHARSSGFFKCIFYSSYSGTLCQSIWLLFFLPSVASLSFMTSRCFKSVPLIFLSSPHMVETC